MADKVARDILDEKNDMRDNYLKFLHIGGSLPTLDSLKVVGIDFTDEGLFLETLQHFEELLNQYENVLKIEKKK